ncbi:MAG: hypothetical protein Q9207_004302 [Kuettlingeria erythrocarpa]
MDRPVEFQNAEAGEKSKTKRRGNLPKQTTDILRAWLHEHLDHAYPNEEEKQQLIRETGLTDKQPNKNKSSRTERVAALARLIAVPREEGDLAVALLQYLYWTTSTGASSWPPVMVESSSAKSTGSDQAGVPDPTMPPLKPPQSS